MSSCSYSALPNLPLPSPDTNPEKESEIPHYFDNFDVLLIYSNFNRKYKYDKNITIFAISPNLAQLPTPDVKAKIEKIDQNKQNFTIISLNG